MGPSEMDRLIEQHLAAERAKDPGGSVAVYTEDVEHDVVGSPTGPVHGKEAAHRFYEYLNQNTDSEGMAPLRTHQRRGLRRFEQECARRLQDHRAADGYELIKRVDLTAARRG
jgi:hypothetical protein